MTSPPIVLMVTSEGNAVYLNGHLIGYGPMLLDRKLHQNTDAVTAVLADLVRERLGWPQNPGEDL